MNDRIRQATERRVAMSLACAAVALGLALGGCGSPKPEGVADGAPPGPVDLSGVHDAVPRVEPRSRYGNPPSYQVFGKTYQVMDSAKGYRERGIASWYGTKFHGRRTSSGEPYDLLKMTAAHKRLPLPTYVEVRNLENGRRVIVKVNDRGPFHEGRIIDLSYAAAHKLGMAAKGTAPVEVIAIDPREWARAQGRAEDAGTPAAAMGAWIQVGAFRERSNAERLRRELDRRLARDAWVRISDDAVGGLHRVRIGPVRDAREAGRIALRLRAQGYVGAHVVTKPARPAPTP